MNSIGKWIVIVSSFLMVVLSIYEVVVFITNFVNGTWVASIQGVELYKAIFDITIQFLVAFFLAFCGVYALIYVNDKSKAALCMLFAMIIVVGQFVNLVVKEEGHVFIHPTDWVMFGLGVSLPCAYFIGSFINRK